MRRMTAPLQLLTALSTAVAACGGAPPAPVAPAPLAPATVSVPPAEPPPAPPAPKEPARLGTITAPAEVCALAGSVGEDALELAGSVDGPAFAVAAAGQAKVTIGASGATFAEVTTPTLTVRGLVPRSGARLRTARWVSFGGVYFPGSSAALAVTDAHDGKVVVAAPHVDGFTLAEGSRTAEVACGTASLATDPEGNLAREAPPLFLAKGKSTPTHFKAKVQIPISAEPTGPVVGFFDATDEPTEATLLEQRGARSRVRVGHVAGWIDTKLIAPPKRLSSREAALAEALAGGQFGMIGLLSSGGTSGAPTKKAEEEPTQLVCPVDVRVVAEARGDMGARFVVGSIGAGKPVRVADKTEELAYLAPDPSSALTAKDARLAVPTRDLAACKAEATTRAQRAAPVASATPRPDAIDALDPDRATLQAKGNMWGDTIGESFGAGGLGLSGVGQGGGTGEGIGLGNIGTLGHGAGTGTGQGFGTGHGRLGGASGATSPSLRQGATQVNGRLPPEVIQRIVRQNFGRFRLCYENGLRTAPTLQGRVSVKFVIDEKGAVKSASDEGSDLPDQGVVSCVVRSFANLSFPQPEGGKVTVVYPIIFNPGEPAPKPAAKPASK